MQLRYRWISLLLLALLAACAPANTSASGKSLVYGLTFEPSGFDPHINASAELGIPLRQVYDTLLYRHPETGAFVAGLATEWTISDDGLIYTLTLRQGVTFHDGTAFNSQSVASNLDRITNPENGSQKAVFLLGPYERYEIVDEFTIRLFLSEPFSPLLDSLSQVYLGMASPARFEEFAENNRYQFHQAGTGPFRFVEYVPGDFITLERNPNYTWGPEFYHTPETNSVQRITFNFYADPATRALALQNGQVDIMGELPPLDARVLTNDPNIRVIPVDIPGEPLQFLINVDRFPTDNLAVRQAVLYGANRNAIVDAVFQQFSPIAWGPLTSSSLYFNPEVNGRYAHDTGQALTLLEQEGFVDTNNNGYVEFNGVDLTLDVIVPPWGLLPDVSQLLQEHWRTIGIKANLISVPTRGALVEQVQSGNYNLVAFDTFGIDPNFLNQFYQTDGPNNWSNYTNPELDLLLQDAVRQTDPNVRFSLYAQAQNIVMNDAIVLPVRDYVNLNGARMSVEGLEYDAYGWFPILNNVSVAD